MFNTNITYGTLIPLDTVECFLDDIIHELALSNLRDVDTKGLALEKKIRAMIDGFIKEHKNRNAFNTCTVTNELGV